MSKNSALLIFVKYPDPSNVKTRLQSDLTSEDAASLYRAMVEDIVSRFKNVLNYDVILFFSPGNAGLKFENWLGNSFKYVTQQGEDLGEKMYNAFVWASEQSYQQAVLIGSDLPTLESGIIDDTFDKLANADVVLGPTVDGGYYLIGLKKPNKQIFKNIHWGTDVVFSETLKNVSRQKLAVTKIKMLRDLDTMTDVLRLWNFLKLSNNEQIKTLPETYNVIKKIINNNEELK